MGNFLGSYTLTLVLLFFLMFVIVVGAIEQNYIGFDNVQKEYFSSFFFFFQIWKIPFFFPGAHLLLLFLFCNLSFALFFRFQWKLELLGFLISQIGILTLLLGTFLSSYFFKKGSLSLYEGETKSEFLRSHQYELAIIRIDPQDQDYLLITAYPERILKRRGFLPPKNLPFSLQVKAYYPNSKRVPYKRAYKVVPLPVHIKQKENQPGCILRIGKVYEISLFTDVYHTLRYRNKNYTFVLRKKRESIPFRFRLLKFTKESYPGTDLVKKYESFVEIIIGQTVQRVRITPKHSFRYRDFTISQTSYKYNSKLGKYRSIFTVSKNPISFYPYFSCPLIALGLVMHFTLQFIFSPSRGALRE